MRRWKWRSCVNTGFLCIGFFVINGHLGRRNSAVILSLIPENGFSGSASVTVSGFPLGITVSPALPFNIQAGMTQSVTFSAPTPAGMFDVTLSAATGGVLSHTKSLSPLVTPMAEPHTSWLTPTISGISMNSVRITLGLFGMRLREPPTRIGSAGSANAMFDEPSDRNGDWAGDSNERKSKQTITQNYWVGT